jgi:hypothetical protein
VFDAASSRLMWATLTQPRDALAADAHADLFDASGAITAYPIMGSHVSCQGLAVADDGSAIVMIESNSGFGGTAIRVGSRTFDHGPDTTFYVLNISL